MDSSPPSSPVHGILQARILEWVAISFSKERKKVIFLELTGVEALAPRWPLTGLVLRWVSPFLFSGSLLGHLEGPPLQWWAAPAREWEVGGFRLHLSQSRLRSRRLLSKLSLLQESLSPAHSYSERNRSALRREDGQALKLPILQQMCLLKTAVLPLLWKEVVAPQFWEGHEHACNQ